MAKCTKEQEIELSNGRTVEVTITVEGYFDAHHGADADGNRGMSAWFVDSWDFECEEELTDDERDEVKERVEEIALEESWDFATAKDDEEADEYEPEEL